MGSDSDCTIDDGKHEEKRLEWGMEKISWNVEKWKQVVFTDEKKFNMDGPDGFRNYWHDLRRERRIFSKRQNGGGSLMVWGGLSSKGKTELAILDGNQDYENFTQLFGTT